MSERNPDDNPLLAMSLLATLRTAAAVCQALSLRKSGRDPSEQEEPPAARQHLRAARSELRGMISRLRLSLIVERPEETELVQAFEDRMLLAHAARDLHLVHQRLLSLYPSVDETLVEEARRLQAEAGRLATSEKDGFREAVAAWCEGMANFLDHLGESVYTAN